MQRYCEVCGLPIKDPHVLNSNVLLVCSIECQTLMLVFENTHQSKQYHEVEPRKWLGIK